MERKSLRVQVMYLFSWYQLIAEVTMTQLKLKTDQNTVIEDDYCCNMIIMIIVIMMMAKNEQKMIFISFHFIPTQYYR
jgi:hypothetical protein